MFGSERLALVDADGYVQNVVLAPEAETVLVPVFIDGEQAWDEQYVTGLIGETDDGKPLWDNVLQRTPRMQEVPAWTPPDGLTAVPAPDQVGPGWRYMDGEWIEPPAPPEPEPSEDQRLADALRAILTPEQISQILS